MRMSSRLMLAVSGILMPLGSSRLFRLLVANVYCLAICTSRPFYVQYFLFCVR